MKPPNKAARPTTKQNAPNSNLQGEQCNERFPKSTAVNTVIGCYALCAWQPALGTTWVQSRSPEFTRKLDQRSDSRLVLWGVAGGYLRTFEFKHDLAWARRLILRYVAELKATNEPQMGVY
jgi:hypothetical protein